MKRSIDAGRLATPSKFRPLLKSKYSLAWLAGLAGAVVLGVCGAVALPSLSYGQVPVAAELAQHWSKGEVVMLVRHAERCDRSSAPCLGAADGITVRGSEQAALVGHDYRALDLSHTDVYASPMTRTAQTAEQMFGANVIAQSWVADCKGDVLKNVLQHKVAHRNLVLVTHSECMAQIVQAIDHHDLSTPEYTSSLVLFSDDKGALQVAGQIEPQDWAKMNIR
ncbi:lipopolysaccharide core heptose(II)-phosphate phosphatase PmrG [Pseudomonas panipatensis]|uniref:Histidine phosphatase superfamily (Branch 1) n=1 Tax=Pseudomonas panipatensis TaxID=428992 RepID=A0A1G8CRC0_9PSED|nr:histidine phosphatase family protein [Pseudomonas panipatensis]SDH48035.1 Histidine phosphatase superfamily (branch 1) [Pseudomonas panipatensis]SMP63777.1 Histidine phosphatase superfamily (branch 1) [Pseudomonas panipatensis]